MKVLFRRILAYFLKGLSIVIPFGVCLYLPWYIFWQVEARVRSLVSFSTILSNNTVPSSGLRVLATSAIITLIGFLAPTFLLSPLVTWLEGLVMRTPIFNILYSYIKEGTFGAVEKLSVPVLITLNHKDGEIYKIGFLTQEKLDILSLTNDEVIVYMPHSYSYSFSGEMAIFPKNRVKKLEISTTEAMRLVVTGGLAEIKRPLMISKRSKK